MGPFSYFALRCAKLRLPLLTDEVLGVKLGVMLT